MTLDSDTTSTVTPVETATLKIRKSENEILELPLTTQKPIARSLAVFQDGKVYYCPLVHSGEYLDSGVKIRIGDTTYALATQIYNPVTYDSSGRQWTVEGSPIHVMRDSLYLPGNEYLEMTSTVNLTSSSSFSFRCRFSFSKTVKDSQTLFNFYISATKQFFLGVVNGNALKLFTYFNSSSGTAIKALSGSVPNVNEMHFTEVSYNNSVWAFNFDGTDLGTVSKSILAGDYYIRIGNGIYGDRGINGWLYNLSLSFDNTVSNIRFGD